MQQQQQVLAYFLVVVAVFVGQQRLVCFSFQFCKRFARLSNGVSPKSYPAHENKTKPQKKSRPAISTAAAKANKEKGIVYWLPPSQRTRRPWIAECGIESTIKKSNWKQKEKTKSNGITSIKKEKLLPCATHFFFSHSKMGKRETLKFGSWVELFAAAAASILSMDGIFIW